MLPLWRPVVALCVIALFGVGHAFAAAGTVDSLEGEVRISNARGVRPAQAGLELEEGDTVYTGPNAWALLTMVDGASITTRPTSQLRIDTYRYNAAGAASENSVVLSLLQGAFRSITGYIGQTNRAGYRITSPSATIGIRGTDHEPAYIAPSAGQGEQNPGTYDKVNDGESFIRNPRGEVSVRPGQSGFVHHNARTPPQLLARTPAFYQRHAEIDKRAAARREAFHQRVREDRAKRGASSDAQEKRGGADTQKENAQKAREHEKADREKRGEERRQERAQQREARKERQQDAHKKHRD